jgi:ATP-dependent Clp protease adaptor protein ClpS
MKEKEYTGNRPEYQEIIESKKGESKYLILHNDDYHTFDYVIDTLIKICELEAVQAEQCTYLVHYKGKCDVKKGNFNFLKPFKEGLIEKGLNATID